MEAAKAQNWAAEPQGKKILQLLKEQTMHFMRL
jgi:hypothetical protein